MVSPMVSRSWVAMALAAAVACASDASKPIEGLEDEVAALRADLEREAKELKAELHDIRLEIARGSSRGDSAPSQNEPAPTAPEEPEANAPSPAPAKPPDQETVRISIGSNPTGARVLIDGTAVGTTPLLFERKTSSQELTLRLEKTGYRPRLMTLRADEDSKLYFQLAKK